MLIDGLSEEISVVFVGYGATFCVNTVEVLAPKVELPPYCAVMECDPLPNVVVLNVASPFVLRAPVPSEMAPSKNVTVPDVGVPPDGLVTIAVNWTDCPKAEGLKEERTCVEVAIGLFVKLKLAGGAVPALAVTV